VWTWTWTEFLRVAALVVAVQIVTAFLLCVGVVWYVTGRARRIRRIIESTPRPLDLTGLQSMDPEETNAAAHLAELERDLRG
jgi:hypothetical protein